MIFDVISDNKDASDEGLLREVEAEERSLLVTTLFVGVFITGS